MSNKDDAKEMARQLDALMGKANANPLEALKLARANLDKVIGRLSDENTGAGSDTKCDLQGTDKGRVANETSDSDSVGDKT